MHLSINKGNQPGLQKNTRGNINKLHTQQPREVILVLVNIGSLGRYL